MLLTECVVIKMGDKEIDGAVNEIIFFVNGRKVATKNFLCSSPCSYVNYDVDRLCYNILI